MIDWMLENLKFYKMFNSRLVHQKVMIKSNFLRSKTEQFVFCDPISRSMQTQLELFLMAVNKYYSERLEKNNIMLELNCAFQKTDIFDGFFSILMFFSSLFSFGLILAHQTSSGMFSEWFRFIWHHWGPWGRVNSGEKGFSDQTATVSCGRYCPILSRNYDILLPSKISSNHT